MDSVKGAAGLQEAPVSPIPVLHVITRLANGGAAENTIYTVNGLDRSAWQVDLAIGGTADDDRENGDRVEKLEIAPHVTVHRIAGLVRDPGLGELRALRQLRQLIRAGGYRIVHTHGAKAGILGRMAAHRENVPVIINGIHGHTFSPQMSLPARTVYRGIERWVGRYTTHFISVGDDLRQQYLSAGVGTQETFSVIHSGMDLDRFLQAGNGDRHSLEERAAVRRELGIPENAVVVANISRMEPRKGHRFFLEAAAQVVHSAGARSGDPWFVIVGDGPEEGALRAQAGHLGIADRTVFTGYRRDVERMFAMADIVVLTSLWEGLPRVLVQAAAAGRPVVTFACDGAREVVHEGVNGHVVPMRDVSAVGGALNTLVHNEALRHSMGAAGRTLVNESWRVEAMVTQIDTLYRRLLT